VFIANQSDRVGERERCAFPVVEEGRFVPGGDSVEALLAPAGPTRDLRVLVDAVRAAVQDRCAQVDEFPQARVELDFVSERDERAVERRRRGRSPSEAPRMRSRSWS
jgi:hypothetical protein